MLLVDIVIDRPLFAADFMSWPPSRLAGQATPKVNKLLKIGAMTCVFFHELVLFPKGHLSFKHSQTVYIMCP